MSLLSQNFKTQLFFFPQLFVVDQAACCLFFIYCCNVVSIKYNCLLIPATLKTTLIWWSLDGCSPNGFHYEGWAECLHIRRGIGASAVCFSCRYCTTVMRVLLDQTNKLHVAWGNSDCMSELNVTANEHVWYCVKNYSLLYTVWSSSGYSFCVMAISCDMLEVHIDLLCAVFCLLFTMMTEK